jgi:hypothetical protein
MDQLWSQLADLVKQLEGLAPTIWNVARTQVVIDARYNLLWLIVSVVAIVLLAIVFVRTNDKVQAVKREDRYSVADEEFGLFLCAVGIIAALVIATLVLVNYAKVTTNPDWYAIQLLLSQVK